MSEETTVVIPPEMLERMLVNCISLGLVKLEKGKRYTRTMALAPSGLEVTWREIGTGKGERP